MMKNDRLRISLFRILEKVLKFAVVGSDIIMTLHCALLLMDGRSQLAEYLCGHCVVGVTELLIASFLLHFCWAYRSCLLHNFAVYSCIVYERAYGFGAWLEPVRWMMLLCGVICLIWVTKVWLYGKEQQQAQQ